MIEIQTLQDPGPVQRVLDRLALDAQAAGAAFDPIRVQLPSPHQVTVLRAQDLVFEVCRKLRDIAVVGYTESPLDEAFLEFRTHPSLRSGSTLLGAVRTLLALAPPDGESASAHVAANVDTPSDHLADVLLGMLDFTPGACHWALNVAADRLRGHVPAVAERPEAAAGGAA